MDQLAALATATAELRRRLVAVGEEDWDRPTPCEGWSVHDLVAHVVGGNQMAVDILHGGTREEAVAALAGVTLGEDPVATFDAGAEAQLAAFDEEGALERTCAHPAGDFSGAQVLGFRIGDLTNHAWDLARALGTDEALDEDLVQVVWDGLQPLAPFIGDLGMFGTGPSGDVGEDAPLQQRMLDLTGRRP